MYQQATIWNRTQAPSVRHINSRCHLSLDHLEATYTNKPIEQSGDKTTNKKSQTTIIYLMLIAHLRLTNKISNNQHTKTENSWTNHEKKTKQCRYNRVSVLPQSHLQQGYL